MRKIDYDLPKEIYKKAEERYIDAETQHLIAVTRTVIYGKERDIMVV